MASVFGSNSDDILIPTAGGNDYRGLAGSDTYIITNLIPARATLTIVDTEGANKIQLIDGLTIKASSFTSSAVQLTLSNDAVITILGATGFTFDLGLNVVAGDTTGTPAQTFAQLATALGVPALPAPGAPPVAGTPGVVIGVPPIPTFTIDGVASANEGTSATYTVTLSSPQAVATTVKVGLTGTGATIGTDTGTLTASGTGVTLAGGVLTFAAGSTTATLTVPIVLDTEAETGDSITLTLSDATGGPTIGTKAAKTTTLGEVPVTLAFTGAASVFEGDTATYTVTASRPVDADIKVSFTLAAADPGGATSGTSKTNLADFAEGAFNTFTATIPKGSTTATYTVTALDDAATELEETYTVSAVAGTTALAPVTTTLKDGATGTGQTFTLTTGVDTIPGLKGSSGTTVNTGDDTIVGIVGTGATWTVLDILDAGTGNDKFVVSQIGAAGTIPPGGSTVTGVEALVWASSADVNIDTTTTFTGLTSLTASAAAGPSVITAAATTSITATQSGAGASITVDGGSSQTVTSSGANVTVGATTVSKGNVAVTHSKLGGSFIAVDGGADVTVSATGSTAGSSVTVGNGGAPTDLPSGAVKVTSAHTGVAGTSVALASINVKGGSTVNVAQTADTSKAATDTVGATLTQGAVTVTAGAATTSVTVNQAASTTQVAAVNAVAGVTESASVKFGALTAGQTLIMGGLTFTASTAMTASEAAATFASLVNGALPATGDSQGSGPASKGTYTGNFTGWTSGAAAGDTVVFTSTTANTNVADLANTGTGTVTITTTNGSAATAAKTGVLGVITGVVTIDDNATAASITTVSVNGYGNGSTIGATNNVSKLATLDLANSGGATAGATNGTMTVNVGAALSSLNLGLNTIKGATTLTGAGLKTLNVTTSGGDSNFALTAAAAESLTVSGDKKATLTADLAALKTVVVNGSAGLVLSGLEGDTLTSVNSSGTTGAVSASIDGTKATYTGGAGVDTVTLVTATALTKAIDLGGGDDTLSFAALAVSGSTTTLSGGGGTDTLSMSAATADTLDGSAVSFYTQFERLLLNTAAGDNDDSADTVTIDLANLGFTNYVSTNGTVLDTTTATKSDTLVLDKLASGGTVAILAAAAGANTKHTIQVKDAATGTADVANVVLSSAGALTAGTVTVPEVETVNVSTVDTDTTPHDNSMTLTADKATSVTISGGPGLTLTMTGSTKVTSIDGSTMTRPLVVTSANTTSATTIKGGSGNDILTAANATTADVLLGGAGEDTLNANQGLSTLTGGAGNDMFVIGVASLNSSSFSTITDFTAGDLIKFTGAASFQAVKVTLADTAVFQDYADAAINSIGSNAVAWFQYLGNTYVVMDAGADSTSFTNSQDFIVRLTGLVDLTNASFNDTSDTIAL